jgi:hypothetical protein
MKLHEVPRGTYIKVLKQSDESPYSKYKRGDQIDIEDAIAQVKYEDSRSEARVPVGAPEVSEGEIIYFDHIDGMYSLCYKVDPATFEHGEICHIAAWTEVEPVDHLESLPFEEIREQIGRAGYGKDGKGEYRQAALKDMSDNWVRASIDYVPKDHPHLKYYKMELEYRLVRGITIEDLES